MLTLYGDMRSRWRKKHLSRLRGYSHQSLHSRHTLHRTLTDRLTRDNSLSHVGITSLARHTNLAHQAFCSRCHSVPSFVDRVRSNLLTRVHRQIRLVATTRLPSLCHGVSRLRPTPNSIRLLHCLTTGHSLVKTLLNPNNSPTFVGGVVSATHRTIIPHTRANVLNLTLNAFFSCCIACIIDTRINLVRH